MMDSVGNPMMWKYYFRLIRPLNLGIMALMLILVRYAIFVPVFQQNSLIGLMPWWQFLMLVLATILIGAGGYVINDVLDIEIDQINKPEKQIIGKQISESAGNKLHTNLTGAGIVIGIAFSYLSGNIFLAVMFVIIPTALFYYSYKYKYLPAVGNLVVALLAGITVLIYWLFEFYNLKKQPELFIDASLSFSGINRFVLSFAFFAFLTTFIREIVKDAQDVEGDKRFGCRTLPVIFGNSGTKFFVAVFVIITMATVSWFQYKLFTGDHFWISYALGITQIFLLFSLYKSLKAVEKHHWATVSTLLKLVMLTGMVSLCGMWIK
jgi:4-hydroxybenzoate polyprenyltransferase